MFEIFISNFYGTIGTFLGGWCGGYYGGHGYGMMGGFWPLGMLFTGIFWIAVIAMAVWAIGRLTAGRRAAHAPAESHTDILKRRLAAGEITTDEFSRLKKTIEEKE
ncbi:MAG: SHOCT domain-containing protein [Deltaproteobacteria bacterium]|nr:SHOCT domain-containing protein [Candidatus Zymogenaceae bacterium]